MAARKKRSDASLFKRNFIITQTFVVWFLRYCLQAIVQPSMQVSRRQTKRTSYNAEGCSRYSNGISYLMREELLDALANNSFPSVDTIKPIFLGFLFVYRCTNNGTLMIAPNAGLSVWWNAASNTVSFNGTVCRARHSANEVIFQR